VPLELHAGVALRPVRDWTVMLGAGPGLTDGLGTPDARAYLAVRFAPAAEVDTDGDGIPDDDDRCPRKPEDHDGVRDRDGCPDDRDPT